MFRRAALETPTARDIARKSGFRAQPATSVAVPTSVLSQGWIVQRHPSALGGGSDLNDSRGILYAPFVIPSEIEFWPTGDPLYTSVFDLSGFSVIRNVLYVDPATPHPDYNVKVEASLDETTWGDVALDDDWKFSGANVNLGGWPATIGEAHGGAIASEWMDIAPAYLTGEASVKLRWKFFVSPPEGVYDPEAETWGTLVFGYGDVQVA